MEKGETTYTSYPFENEAFEVRSVTVADIDATGHAYGEPEWSWAADHGSVTAVFTCGCGDRQEVTADAGMTEISAATATEDQVVKYTATITFGGVTYSAETENITVPGTAAGTPDKPFGEKRCKWCDQVHRGFLGAIVGFFHSILYFFAHLFGRR